MRIPTDREDLRARTHKAIEEFLERQARALDEVSTDCAPMLESVAELMRDGKRLRPAFCYWAWRGAGGPDAPQIAWAAAALEFFQAAAIIHDDVMDNSATRRGRPAVHRRFAALHRSAGWAGDSDRFGMSGAILTGDLCLVWSEEMFHTSGLDPAVLDRGRPVFDRMRSEVMGGQFLDLLAQVQPLADAAALARRAREVVRFKSAKYSVEHPLLLGGSLAGAGAELLASYSAYGLPLGEAFQLRDDVLGVFGDPGRTGKPAGDDLREGKRTVLVIEALTSASPAQAGALRSLVGDPALDDRGVATVREIIIDTGALATVEQLIESLAERSRAALAAAEVAEPARTALAELITAATERTT